MQVTLLREYSQGVGEMMWVLPTGAYDPRRHSTPLAAGQAELSEEVKTHVVETSSQHTHSQPVDCSAIRAACSGPCCFASTQP